MSVPLNETHDPKAQSWVASANAVDAEFPLQNLPLGIYAKPGIAQTKVGVAIGDSILDVLGASHTAGFSGAAAKAAEACNGENLNALLTLDPAHWSALRLALFRALRSDTPETLQQKLKPLLTPQAGVEMRLPIAVADYTDFYASIQHASNASRVLGRPEPVRPAYHYLPVAYHGRASSIVVSGTPVRRPKGQFAPEGKPVYEASRKLDYELEMGIVIGGGSELGTALPLVEAEAHVFGLCLLNDWSARDIQFWEGQPLGPFLGKNFATTISPWIVTLEALAPFRVAMEKRAEGAPVPLAHLTPKADEAAQAIAVALDVFLSTTASRAAGKPPQRLSRSNFASLYWSIFQMIAHHTSNGCNLRPADLMGSGTVSGWEKDQMGCLLERSADGLEPFAVGGETRGYLADGDQVTFRAHCSRDGFRGIGFGTCAGEVKPA
jgi:fumarylacetoacetase